MAPVGTYLRQTVAVALGALVVGSVQQVDGAEPPVPAASSVVFHTPVDDGTTTDAIHIVLGADPTVASVQLAASRNGGTSWRPIGELLTRHDGSQVFETTVQAAGPGAVRLRATAYDADLVPLGAPAEEDITVSSAATRFTFTSPGSATAQVGVYKRADRRWFATVSGTTTGTSEPVLDAPAPPSIPVPAPQTRFAAPTGRYDAVTGTFTEPVDLSVWAAVTPAPTIVPVRVADGPSTDVVDAAIYPQTVTAVRSTTATVPGSKNVTVTTRVTDQYGQPVTGAVVRLAGWATGATTGLTQLAVSDALGQVTFTGPYTAPATGSDPAVATGYPAGFYVAYVDLDLDRKRDATEPSYESVVGTVSFAAPGKRFYHDNTRTRYGGGVLADSVQGTRAAAAKGYTWIDQDGQLSYTTHAGLRRGAARVSSPAHLTWVNAHGAPFLPKWMRKGDRFERRSWGSIRRMPGLRSAELTFRQNASYGLSTEWEVKDIRPFTTQAALNAAFTDLATAAQRYYGPTWQTRVVVKMLSDLTGGPAFALKVLKVARAHGFTTIYLARGKQTSTQIPPSAHRYVTYVRGAQSGVYAPIPPANQELPVTVSGPPALRR